MCVCVCVYIDDAKFFIRLLVQILSFEDLLEFARKKNLIKMTTRMYPSREDFDA